MSPQIPKKATNSPFVKIMQGDVLEQLRQLEDDSINCVVTSPPYWGLRDYSRCGCANQRLDSVPAGERSTEGGEMWNTQDSRIRPTKEPAPSCPICHGTGRIKGTERQIGLELTPEEYIAKMTEVFHEVKRVLRADGTCWVNMGDCYANERPGHGGGWATNKYSDGAHNSGSLFDAPKTDAGLAPKNLVGQPWRLAFALQADGWYLRSDIIWAKANPMPESVTDRPTKSHEYIFLLTKSARYFYDQEAVKERTVYQDDRVRDREHTKLNHTPGRTHSCGLKTNNYEFRNLRTVWNIKTQPYPEAHFATFPEEIPSRCIKAGCPAGGIVLDPFAGSGTTGAVARGLGRSCILIELNPEYVKLIEDRTDAKVQALTAFEVVL